MTDTESMTVAEYAAYERAMGAQVAEVGGVFWRRVRPLFYRPLLPFQPLEPSSVQPPPAARWGGWQCAVSDPGQANGAMAFLMFRNAGDYRLDGLEKKRRWEVRSAAQHFSIHRLGDVEELLPAYEAFVQFQRRTGYVYRADRVRLHRFAEWAHEIFRHPKIIVLAACENAHLQAVSILLPVGSTLIYATFFASDNALRRHVASLMLHSVRSLGAQSPGIRQVFVGLRKCGSSASVDDFYLLRGAEVVVLSMYTHLHPLAAWSLKRFRPDLMRRIMGARPSADRVATTWPDAAARMHLGGA